MAAETESIRCCDNHSEDSAIEDGSMPGPHHPYHLPCSTHTDGASNRSTTFRFLDLPNELRLVVYAELLHGRASHNGRTSRHWQILATSKAVHEEAENELYHRSDMSIKITATASKTHDSSTHTVFSVGNIKVLDAINCFNTDIEPAWTLCQRLPTAVSKIRKISLAIDLEADQTNIHLQRRPFSAKQYNQVHHTLTAIAAASYGTLHLMKVQVSISDGAAYLTPILGAGELNGVLWPLASIASNVEMSLHGLPDKTIASLFSQRADADNTVHPFTLFRNMRANVQRVMEALKHNTKIGKHLGLMLRSVEGTLEERRWKRNHHGLVDDLKFLEDWIARPNMVALMADAQKEKEEMGGF